MNGGGIGLQKIRDDEQDGERFWIVFIDGVKAAEEHGYVRSTLRPMTETEVRDFLAKGRPPCADIEAMFRLAREEFLGSRRMVERGRDAVRKAEDAD